MYQEDVVLMAGTIAEHETAPGVWSVIPSLTVIGAIGEQSEPKEKTNLADKIKKYGSGMRDAPDKNLQGQYIPVQEVGSPYEAEYVLQQAFFKRCKDEEEFRVRVTFPDGDQSSFLFKALGFQVDDVNQEEWKMFTCNGKQNSRVLWGLDISGGTTVATGADLQLSVTADPVGIDIDVADVEWSSSDELIATVDTDGLVTAGAVGTATITAVAYGITGTVEITVS